jgi:DNA repair exonuclease SbcCD ATPase subunit
MTDQNKSQEHNPVKELTDYLTKNKIGVLFWTCPKGCHGQVEWTEKDKPHPLATCKVCGMTNKSQESEQLKLRITDIPSTRRTLPVWIGSENNISMAAVYGKENAERIVACWNFCAGICTETLTLLNQADHPTLQQICERNQSLEKEIKSLQSRAEQAEKKLADWTEVLRQTWRHACINHTDAQRANAETECPVCAISKAEQAEQKLEKAMKVKEWLLKWGYLGEPMTVTGLAFDELREILKEILNEKEGM